MSVGAKALQAATTVLAEPLSQQFAGDADAEHDTATITKLGIVLIHQSRPRWSRQPPPRHHRRRAEAEKTT
jgi:hypothetical protein